jgi:hypothetical protein
MKCNKKEKWATFIYCGPETRIITKLLKKYGYRNSLQTTNTIKIT